MLHDSVAGAYKMNVACHNLYDDVSAMRNAQFCAALPNFRIMEIDVDQVPWRDEPFTVVSRIEESHLVVSAGPGWAPNPTRNPCAPIRPQ